MKLPALTLLVALLVALAVTMAASRPADGRWPPSGVYFGWASASDLRLQLLGHTCPAPDGARWLAAELPAGGSLGLRQVNADLGLPLEAAAMLIDDPGNSGHGTGPTRFGSLSYACRSGSSGRVSIGSAELTNVPGVASALTLVTRAADPYDRLVGRLLVSNSGSNALVLEAVEYAPRELATLTVRAAAGSRAQVMAIESGVAPLVDGAQLPPPPSRWDAGHLPPTDPRSLRPRSADDLDLRLDPGETALILVEASSLRRTATPRRLILYPVVTVREVVSGARHSAGFTAPLVGTSRSWLGRWGG